MSSLRNDIRRAVVGIVVFTLLLGIAYPLVIEGISQLAFPGNANGQRAYYRGRLVGSKLIGQSFGEVVYSHGKPQMHDGNPVTTPDPRFFQTRPSGTTPADNDEATTFANYGPNSKVTLAAIRSNIAVYIALNGRYYPGGLTAATVPVDAADTSASGVDPDISIANAEIQAHRVAAVDHLPLGEVRRLISRFTGHPGLGFFGQDTVNVLELNLAIARIWGFTG